MKDAASELWASPEWVMPQRSRLFSISPMGQGTVMVEALHSLVIRLAHAHLVKPAVLVKEEILRDCDINCTQCSAKFVTTYLNTMNGLGKYAAEITTSLEKLTMQSGLDECTFLKWNALFEYRSRRMLHLHPQWCPLCFEHWRLSGVEPYYPLIWQSIIVRHCPVHEVPLEQNCPGCGKAQPFVPRHYYLDHCSYCGCSLAQQGDAARATAGHCISADAQRSIDAVTEMITLGASIRHLLTAEHFWQRLQEAADRFYEGKVKSFEKSIGFAEGVFSNWKLGRHKPSFIAFYQFTSRLNTTPVAFLIDGIPDSFCPPDVKLRAPKRTPVRLTAAEQDRLKSALREIIARGYSELPMRDIAAQLGRRHTFLIYWFQDECRQISSLHRQWVRAQAKNRADTNRNLAIQMIQELYARRVRVTRDLMDDVLGKVGLSLQDPVVREAVYALRTDQLAGSIGKDRGPEA
ncbi:TniQ family protein [Paraburkholderia megapolitana]|uniref:Transcriptional regulator, TetR family n=1 Tax=Paraburkholderia megapolitana TaxID=420953 RepID=A0A1I3JJQ9_9BURK|nr:TniQ family protein [Paraburkholderia megapolitana]QDQ84774.1 TniQ family protein [Paraburkholderia megapolitana]SFI60370.1 transcriptional regulator, TetR family [Paraburkholderia megapolitana]